MSDAEVQALTGLVPSLLLLLVGAGFLNLAIDLARRWIPPTAEAFSAWTLADVCAVVLLPVAALMLMGRLVPGDSVLVRLIESELGLAAGALWLVLRARRSPGGLSILGLRSAPSGRALLAGPIAFLPLFLFLAGVGSLWALLTARLGWPSEQEILQLLRDLRGADLAVAGALAILVVPFLEELLFRGFLQQVLSARLGARAGLVVTSLLFASLHGVAGLPVLFTLSLFLGWLQQRSRCLFLPVSVHALNNAVSLALAFALPRG